MRTPRSILLLFICAGACVLAACTSAHRSRAELDCARDEYLESAARRREEMIQRIVRRMARDTEDYAAGRTDVEPVFDVLVISGGSDKGAFGAAFLAAWGATEGPLARPEFDVVTGVSTGALIAPFVFASDPDSDCRICELYQNPQPDWIGLNGLLFLFEDSVLSPKGLVRDMQREMGPALVAAVAHESAKDRLLAVGTTVLDYGVSHTWDLGSIAEQAALTGDLERFHDVLRASSAVPGIFPPVQIDGETHVDGGASSNILVVGDMLAPDSPRHIFKSMYPDRKLPKIRYWVVLNYQIGVVPALVGQHWLDITGKSVEVMIRSSTVTALRYFAKEIDAIRAIEGADIELRYVSIPDDWRATRQQLFYPPNMRSLAEIGLRMGADPGSWKTDLGSTPLPREELAK